MIERLNAALEGRYRIERELGEGGMATVFLAKDLRHDRKVALKVLKPELAAVVGADRFLAEIKTTAQLQHPHILPLHDSGEAYSFLFYVMPYVEGESLREKLERERQLPVEDALAIAEKVAAALQYAHEQGVVHRDIKPANILLSRGEPVVADFGIALALSQAGDGRITETGLSLGTPHYMSPEQAAGERTLDKRSDVYALGCVTYEMLTGQPPFAGPNAQVVLGRILTGEADPVIEHRKSVPPNVEAAVHKSLQRLPADRFESAKAFSAALRNPSFTADVGVGRTAGTGSMDSPGWKRGALIASAIALLLAAGLTWSWLRPTHAVPVRFQATLPDSLEYFRLFGVNLAVAPDGSAVVFTGFASGETQLWVRPLDQLEPRPIPGTEGARNPSLSPPGDEIAFTSEGRLMAIALAGGPPRTLVPDSVRDAGGGVSWSDDGHIYFTRYDGRIWRIAEEGGFPEPLTEPGNEGDGDQTWIQALPGGRGVLFTRDIGTPADDRIEVLSLKTRETKPLFDGAMARYAATGHLVYTDGSGNLFVVRFDPDRLEVTGPPRLLVEDIQVNTGSASQFAVSRSGTLVYAVDTGLWLPVWLDRNGALEAVDPEWEAGDFGNVALSPRDDRLAVTIVTDGAEQLWVKELPDGPLIAPTAGDGRASRPVWMPDGRSIAYIAEERRHRPHVRVVRADGSSPDPDTLLALEHNISEIQIVAEDRLLYRFETGTSRDIGHAELVGDTAVVSRLLDSEFDEQAMALSPDKQWLAYISDISGRYEVYVRPFPDVAERRVQISASGGTEPVWAHSTREIFYRDGEGWMTVATLATQPEFQVQKRERLFDARRFSASELHALYDVTRDDQRFVMFRRGGERLGGTPLVVFKNWFEELRRAMEGQ